MGWRKSTALDILFETYSLMRCDAVESHRNCTNISGGHIVAIFRVDSSSGLYALKMERATLSKMVYFYQNTRFNIPEDSIFQSYAVRT